MKSRTQKWKKNRKKKTSNKMEKNLIKYQKLHYNRWSKQQLRNRPSQTRN